MTELSASRRMCPSRAWRQAPFPTAATIVGAEAADAAPSDQFKAGARRSFWWVGGLAGTSGSGKRETTGCGATTAVWCPGARSLWSLVFTKPKPGRHGARGTSWSYKCPLWMSSTRWGKVATVSGEGGVACGDLATGGTESSGLCDNPPNRPPPTCTEFGNGDFWPWGARTCT